MVPQPRSMARPGQEADEKRPAPRAGRSWARGGREQNRRLNQAIDLALLELSPSSLREVLLLGGTRDDAAGLAERVLRRAARLSKADPVRRPHILRACDALVLAGYRAAAPKGWFCGWCDASVVRRETGPAAAIGGVLMDADGRIATEICADTTERQAFEAEIAAAVAILKAARARHAQRIRVHTDCKALVNLWLRQRRDPRLTAVRELARAFRRVEICAVARRHNQPAHRLAAAALPSQHPPSASQPVTGTRSHVRPC